MEAYVARMARNLSISASERNAKNAFLATLEVLSEARRLLAPRALAGRHAGQYVGRPQ